MAIIKPTKTVEVIPQDRTRLIEIASPFGQIPTLTAHRESIEVAAGEVVKRENAPSTTRTLAQVAELSHTCADGTMVKVRHLAECLPAWIDAWAQEDAQ